jgi:hypothetical protein
MVAAGGLSLASGGIAKADTQPGRWSRLESSNFVIHSSSDETYSRSELVALEGYHSLLTRLMPPRSKSALKLNIYMAGSEGDFDDAWPGVRRSTIAGFYTRSVEEVIAVTSKRSGSRSVRNTQRALDARTILFHEYSHHYMMANQRAAYPGWYVEGFAEFLSTAEFTDKGIYIGKFTPDRAQWLAQSDWVDINTFLTKRAGQLNAIETFRFYAQAWLAMHYIFNNPDRSKGFDRYIRALGAGEDVLGAFEPSFGVTPEAFDDELRGYRRKGIEFRLMAGVTADPLAPITVQRLNKSADELVMSCAYLRQRPTAKEAAGTVADIRAQARKYPGDKFAMRSEALAEVWFGDLARAREIIDALLTSDAGNPEVLHLSGLCYLRAGYAAQDKSLVKQARSAFAAAHRLDGTRAGSLFRYVECGIYPDGQVDEHLLDALLAAYRLAPQVDSIALMTAQGLAQHKRFAEAVLVLRPLAADVHGGASEIAQTMLAAALAEQQPTSVVLHGSAMDFKKMGMQKSSRG